MPQGRSGQVRNISPPTAIRSPDPPARSQSLYRLSYPAHKVKELGSFETLVRICHSLSINILTELNLELCFIRSIDNIKMNFRQSVLKTCIGLNRLSASFKDSVTPCT